MSLTQPIPTRLESHTAGNGVVFWASPVLSRGSGVPHGFMTRIGGVSTGDGATLDLNCAGDGGQSPAPRADVAENYRRALEAIGCRGRRAIWVNQVHGHGVVEVDLRGAPQPPAATAHAPTPPQPIRCGQGDALITTDPGVVLTVRVADCVPILLSSRRGDVVAAVHAGWRGIVAEVLARTIGVLQSRYRVAPGSLLAAVGPCIGADAFEVGPEVAAEFDTRGLGACVRRDQRPKPHIDLEHAAALQLAAAGVPESQISLAGLCTFARPDQFYSHRRDNGKTGRQAAMIGVRAD